MTDYWPVLVGIADVIFAGSASLHALLRKRETQSVIGWIGLIWLSPFIGVMLYWAFGVNRIERKGSKILNKIQDYGRSSTRKSVRESVHEPADFPYDKQLSEIGQRLTDRELLPGNQFEPFVGGADAYKAMLHAIKHAKRSISMCSYIFDNDASGKKFVKALAAAQKRGVIVRVLVDDVGSRYSRPSILTELANHDLRFATFLPTSVPFFAFYANLRNHRKIMVIDGEVGFTGGMNIRDGNLNTPKCKHPIQDVHFKIVGPVVEHLQETFIADWTFASNEELTPKDWFGSSDCEGSIWARGIPDGPDEDLDNIRILMLGALASAEERIDIVTPYFLPDNSLISAINVAAFRGIRVRVLIPSECNISIVQWAASEPVGRILPSGCEFYLTPPPFDHSKILLVDNNWSLIGSSNWDPRSLRLNFEFNVECFGTELNSNLTRLVEHKVSQSKPLTQEMLDSRPLLIKLRDGAARLATPYL